jgi:hypothetical protein
MMMMMMICRHWKGLLLEELAKDEYNLRSDYLELILQVRPGVFSLLVR